MVSLFGRRTVPQIERGDRFVKVGSGKVWEVVEIWTAVDGIVHMRLHSGEANSALITIAAGVLADPAFWQPAPRED